MQIRTPKKYRGIQRRRILSCRRLLFYCVMLALIATGLLVLAQRQTLAPIAQDAARTLIRQLEAEAATRSAPPATPTPDPRGKLIEADNYWRQGALSDALTIYLNIADSMPNSVEVFRRIAIAYISQERTAEALAITQNAINADPFAADAWAIRAWALDWAGSPGEAVSSALHALTLDPDNSRAAAYLAEATFSLGQNDRALSLVEAALADDPDSAEAWRASGLIKWLGSNDYAGAIDDFKTAYGIASNMDFIAVDIASIESGLLRNHEAALELLAQVTEDNPRNARALFLTGLIYRSRLGNPAQALRFLQDCVDFDADNIRCHYELGRAQFSLDRPQDALASFERAISLGSQDPYHYWWAGRVNIDLDSCGRALLYLEPGYRLAQASENSTLASDYEAVLPLCSVALALPTVAAEDEG